MPPGKRLFFVGCAHFTEFFLLLPIRLNLGCEALSGRAGRRAAAPARIRMHLPAMPLAASWAFLVKAALRTSAGGAAYFGGSSAAADFASRTRFTNSAR